MNAINFDDLRYTKPDGQSYSGNKKGEGQIRDFREEIRKVKGNTSGSSGSSTSVGDISAENAREKVLQYQQDLERELRLRGRDPSRNRREEEHVLFEKKRDSVFESKTLAELAGMKSEGEINWDADGTDELTEEQIRYLKEKYDIKSLSANEFYNLLAELSNMNVISCEEVLNQLWRPGNPAAYAAGGIVCASEGHFSQYLNSKNDYLSWLKNRNNSILAEIFDRIKQEDQPGNVSDTKPHTHIVYMKTDDMLYSGGNGAGLSFYLKYAKNSTEDDPTIIAKGVDENGDEFEQIIHINQIDPRYATIVEMRALEAFTGVEKQYGFTSLPLDTGNMKLHDRRNFMEMFADVISDMNLLRQRKTADYYRYSMQVYQNFMDSLTKLFPSPPAGYTVSKRFSDMSR